MAYTNTNMRELRTPLSGSFAYASGCGEAGRAVWLNISRTGAAIQLGRYLRPGHLIQLSLESGNDGGWSIPARIAWCVSIPGTLQFQAGLNAVWPGFNPAELPTRPNVLVRAV